MNRTFNTKRLTVSAVMLALSTVLAIVCALIPFLNLPFGGGFTIASMLPIVVVAYMYGVKWGFFVSFTYSVVQIIMDLALGAKGSTLIALFTPNSDSYMGLVQAIFILLLDYLVAYTVLGFGGVFRNRFKSKTASLCLGVVVALALRYLVHIISGYIFYGAWAEWFFSQEGFAMGNWILDRVSGQALALLYSVVYNGLYMIPEIIITALAAVLVSRIPQIKKEV